MKHVAFAAAAVATVAIVGEAAARDQIRIVGSSTVFPFATAVAERFGQKTEFPAPVIESTGSGGGIELFCNGVGEEHPDFTNASRAIKDSEIETCAENGVTEITEVKVGFDGIVVANNIDGPDMDISVPNLFLALAKEVPVDGEIVENPYTMWNEIDESLPAESIEVLGPPPTSGTRDAFVELVMEAGCGEFEEIAALEESDEERFEAVCATMREDGGFVEAGENDNLIVQKLDANPAAYGIFGFSFLDQNRDIIKAASIDGSEPTFDAIESGDYPVSRSLYFYAKNAHVGVIPGMEEYVSEFLGEDAMGEFGYLPERGLIPLSGEELEAMRESATNFTPMGQAS